MPKALPFVGIAAGLTAGALFAAAGSSHGIRIGGLPAFAVLVAAAFAAHSSSFASTETVTTAASGTSSPASHCS